MTKKIELYSRLRYERERLGIDQETLAKIIGCSASNFCNKERGAVPWALRECFIIRDFINKILATRGESAITIDVLFFADIVSKKKLTAKKSVG